MKHGAETVLVLVIAGFSLFWYYEYSKNHPGDVAGVAVAKVYERGGIIDPDFLKWDIIFETLNGKTYVCDVENVEVKYVIWEDKEPGTYVSFFNLETFDHYFLNKLRAEKTILLVMTPEEEGAWNEYLNRKKEAKKIATSPRSVFPPQ